MKKAFTMIELVFVMVIIAILSSLAIPNFEQDRLRQAAEQVVSHIRYTQHLALLDNKFQSISSNPGDIVEDKRAQYWYKGSWQIRFLRSAGGTDNEWAYTIFSDGPNDSVSASGLDDYNGNPNHTEGEIASNILNPYNAITRDGQVLSGGSAQLDWDSVNATSSLCIGHKFGIKDMTFTNCLQRIAFDNLGRPIRSLSSLNDLITLTCRIELCTIDNCNNAGTSEKITIGIEPQTGYAHIL